MYVQRSAPHNTYCRGHTCMPGSGKYKNKNQTSSCHHKSFLLEFVLLHPGCVWSLIYWLIYSGYVEIRARCEGSQGETSVCRLTHAPRNIHTHSTSYDLGGAFVLVWVTWHQALVWTKKAPATEHNPIL